MLAFGLTGCGTSCCNCFVDHFIVASGLDCTGLIVTASAIAALQALLGTGNPDHRIPLTIGVASCNNLIVYIAVAAVAGVGGVAVLGTGGGSHNSLISMTGGGHFVSSVGITTCGAGISGIARLSTGRSGYHRLIVMASSRNHFLSNQNFSASLAVLAFGLTGCGTSCCNCCVDHFGMAQCGNLVCNIAVAAVTGIGSVAVLSTGGIGYLGSVAVGAVVSTTDVTLMILVGFHIGAFVPHLTATVVTDMISVAFRIGTFANRGGAAVVTNVVLIGIYVLTIGLTTAVVAGVILVVVGAGTVILTTAVVTGVILVVVSAGADGGGAAVFTLVVAVGIFMGADGYLTAIITGVIGIAIQVFAKVLVTAVVTGVIQIGVFASADGLGAAVVTDMILAGVYVLTIGLTTAVITGVILVVVSAGAVDLFTTIVTGVIQILVFAGTHVGITTSEVTIVILVIIHTVCQLCAALITQMFSVVIITNAFTTTAVITHMVFIIGGISMHANCYSTAVVAGMVVIGIHMLTIVLGTTVITGMIQIRILTGTIGLTAAIITSVILVRILAGTDDFGATIVAGVVVIRIHMLTVVLVTTVVADMIVVAIHASGARVLAALITDMVFVGIRVEAFSALPGTNHSCVQFLVLYFHSAICIGSRVIQSIAVSRNRMGTGVNGDISLAGDHFNDSAVSVVQPGSQIVHSSAGNISCGQRNSCCTFRTEMDGYAGSTVHDYRAGAVGLHNAAKTSGTFNGHGTVHNQLRSTGAVEGCLLQSLFIRVAVVRICVWRVRCAVYGRVVAEAIQNRQGLCYLKCGIFVDMQQCAGHQLHLLAHIKGAAPLMNLEVVGDGQKVCAGGSSFRHTGYADGQGKSAQFHITVEIHSGGAHTVIQAVSVVRRLHIAIFIIGKVHRTILQNIHRIRGTDDCLYINCMTLLKNVNFHVQSCRVRIQISLHVGTVLHVNITLNIHHSISAKGEGTVVISPDNVLTVSVVHAHIGLIDGTAGCHIHLAVTQNVTTGGQDAADIHGTFQLHIGVVTRSTTDNTNVAIETAANCAANNEFTAGGNIHRGIRGDGQCIGNLFAGVEHQVRSN